MRQADQPYSIIDSEISLCIHYKRLYVISSYDTFSDDQVEIQTRTDSWHLVVGYPKSLSQELNQRIVPRYVSAAAMQSSIGRLYLLCGNNMYEYDTANAPPSLIYRYRTGYDITKFSASNPFYGAPAWVTAFHIEGNAIVAFVGRHFYSYIGSSGWTDHGDIVTPCG